MKREVVKEGPLVLVERIIALEIFSAITFYALSYALNYEQFYRSLSFSQLIRYDILLMLSFSFFQIILIMIVFVYWYFSYFEISEDEIVRVKGIIRRVRKSYRLNKLQSIEINQNILERKMMHATITLIFDNTQKIYIRNVGRFEEAESALNIALNLKNNFKVEDIIASGENDFVEFKETFRFDINKNIPSKEIEKPVLKTIAGFFNAKGGTLLIGVNDKGEISGIQRDFATLKKQDRDGFENYLMVSIKENLGAKVIGKIFVRFEKIANKDICVVEVLPGSEPVFLRNEGKEEFFVRVGNSTQPLSMSEAQSYIKKRFV